MSFRIEGDKQAAVDDPSVEEVEALLDTLHPKERCFFSLTDTRTGSYVQVAGARRRLTVEARQCTRTGFTHSVLGRRPRNAKGAHINCRVGPIHLVRSQVLTLDDAKRVFRQFLETGGIPPGYELEDVSSRYQDGEA